MSRGPLLRGLISAPFTPFHEDWKLNLAAIARQADAARGLLSGVFICGTTGEGISMTLEERMAVAERWMEFRSEELRVIVHVGGVCVADAQRLAGHAQRIGVDAISTIGPLGFKPSSVANLVRFSAEIAGAAPEVPFFYYHMPSLTSVSASMLEYVAIAAEAIPTFQGLKYSHEDLMEYALLLDRYGDKFDMVFGRDEYLLHALQLGARGAVGSTYNYMAPIYLSMMAKHAKGDAAGALADHVRVVEIIQVLMRHGGGVIGGKSIIKLTGLDLGPCRLPLSSPARSEQERLRSDLASVGFFENCVVRNPAAPSPVGIDL